MDAVRGCAMVLNTTTTANTTITATTTTTSLFSQKKEREKREQLPCIRQRLQQETKFWGFGRSVEGGGGILQLVLLLWYRWVRTTVANDRCNSVLHPRHRWLQVAEWESDGRQALITPLLFVSLRPRQLLLLLLLPQLLLHLLFQILQISPSSYHEKNTTYAIMHVQAYDWSQIYIHIYIWKYIYIYI